MICSCFVPEVEPWFAVRHWNSGAFQRAAVWQTGTRTQSPKSLTHNLNRGQLTEQASLESSDCAFRSDQGKQIFLVVYLILFKKKIETKIPQPKKKANLKTIPPFFEGNPKAPYSSINRSRHFKALRRKLKNIS